MTAKGCDFRICFCLFLEIGLWLRCRKTDMLGSQLPFAAPNVNVRSGWKASPHIICVLKPCLHKKYANTLIQQSK